MEDTGNFKKHGNIYSTFYIEGIRIEYELYKIRIFISGNLHSILQQNAVSGTEKFILAIKDEYQRLFDTRFIIPDNSMAVEIWAHVYADKFAKALKTHTSLSFIHTIAGKIMHHAEVIDIGEKGHDKNRFIWDRLAIFKSFIARMLFGKRQK